MCPHGKARSTPVWPCPNAKAVFNVSSSPGGIFSQNSPLRRTKTHEEGPQPKVGMSPTSALRFAEFFPHRLVVAELNKGRRQPVSRRRFFLALESLKLSHMSNALRLPLVLSKHVILASTERVAVAQGPVRLLASCHLSDATRWSNN